MLSRGLTPASMYDLGLGVGLVGELGKLLYQATAPTGVGGGPGQVGLHHSAYVWVSLGRGGRWEGGEGWAGLSLSTHWHMHKSGQAVDCTGRIYFTYWFT